jgi:hypothetical protein
MVDVTGERVQPFIGSCFNGNVVFLNEYLRHCPCLVRLTLAHVFQQEADSAERHHEGEGSHTLFDASDLFSPAMTPSLRWKGHDCRCLERSRNMRLGRST